MVIQLVVADNHPHILNRLENFFQTKEDFQVVARCTNVIEILGALKRNRPDAIILPMRILGQVEPENQHRSDKTITENPPNGKYDHCNVTERLEELNAELVSLNAEARELEQSITENVTRILETR